MDTGKYTVEVECNNCSYAGPLTVLKGKRVDEKLCPTCGCKDLQKKFVSKPRSSPYRWEKIKDPNNPFFPGVRFSPPIQYTSKDQPCLVQQSVEEIRKQRGLPSSAPIVTGIYCSCPRCSPTCTY